MIRLLFKELNSTVLTYSSQTIQGMVSLLMHIFINILDSCVQMHFQLLSCIGITVSLLLWLVSGFRLIPLRNWVWILLLASLQGFARFSIVNMFLLMTCFFFVPILCLKHTINCRAPLGQDAEGKPKFVVRP